MSDDVRERILDTGEMLLRRYGPGKTTVVDIARALDMSHANVYRYFDSKAALLDAIAERWLGRVSAPLEAIVAGSGPAPERLEAWVVTLLKQKRIKVLEDPELFATYTALVQSSRDIVPRHMEDLSGQIRRIISDGVAAGLFRVTDLETAVAMVLDATLPFRHPVLVAERASLPDDLRATAVARALAAALAAGTV